MPSCLRRSLVSNDAPHRLGAGNRELHVPEILFRRDELHTDVFFAISRAMLGNDAALDGLSGVIVYDNEALSHSYDFFELKQSTIAVDRLGMGLHAEFTTGVRFSKHRKGNRDSDS